MPIRLKEILAARGISQQQLADVIVQSNGKPLSRPSLSLIINWGNYPKDGSEKVIREQIETVLRDSGVPDTDLAVIWDPVPDDRHWHVHPVGCHVGQPGHKSLKSRKRHAGASNEFEPLEVEMLNPNARRHFSLFRDPFRDEMGAPDDVFIAADQRYVVEAMVQTARHGGFLAVIGESGSGKTTLRKLLLERIREQPIRVVFPRVLDKTRTTTSTLCAAIINDLSPGETVRASLEAQARQVERILLASAAADYSHVLIIEEAHDLSIATLKYLKRFYELEDGFKKLLSIVLIGQPELRDKLDEQRYPEAREVIRRIEIAELVPLTDVAAYFTHKLGRVGMDATKVFAPDAYDAIRARWTGMDPRSRHAVSDLYPLKLNNVATKAMNRAAELGVPLITGDLIKVI